MAGFVGSAGMLLLLKYNVTPGQTGTMSKYRAKKDIRK
jgi:hypothetical protein